MTASFFHSAPVSGFLLSLVATHHLFSLNKFWPFKTHFIPSIINNHLERSCPRWNENETSTIQKKAVSNNAETMLNPF
jgi:hypothetical protein